MDQHLNTILCYRVFEKLAARFENKKACAARVGTNLAAIRILLKRERVLSALFLSKPLWKGRARIFLHCMSVTFLAAVELAQRKASHGLDFCLFVTFWFWSLKSCISRACLSYQLPPARPADTTRLIFIPVCAALTRALCPWALQQKTNFAALPQGSS